MRSRAGVSGSAPHGGEVGGQVQDALAFVRVDDEPIGGALVLVGLLGLGERAELGVPVGLQRVGDEPVGGIDLHVAVAGAVDLVRGPFDLAVPEAIGLVEAGGDLLLHGERQLEGHRGDGLDDERGDGGVDLGAQDALARRIAEEPAAADTHVVGDERAAAPRGVVHVHAAAAQAADDPALQQRRPFARRPAAAREAERLGRGPELRGDALVLLPRDVGRVRVANQHVPLLLRQAFEPRPSVGLLAPAAPAVDVGAGVPRVVECAGGAAERERRPGQLPLVRPRRHARGEQQALLPEVLDRGVQRRPCGRRSAKSSRTLSCTCVSGSRTTRPVAS